MVAIPATSRATRDMLCTASAPAIAGAERIAHRRWRCALGDVQHSVHCCGNAHSYSVEGALVGHHQLQATHHGGGHVVGVALDGGGHLQLVALAELSPRQNVRRCKATGYGGALLPNPRARGISLLQMTLTGGSSRPSSR